MSAWVALQNADVVINFVERGVMPAYVFIRLYLDIQRGAMYTRTAGVQEQTLTRIIARWRDILSDLTDAQKAALEQSSPGILGRSKMRLDDLALQVRVLGTSAETAHWLENINPLSTLSMKWRQLAIEVNTEDADLKKNTASVLGSNAMRIIREADAAANEMTEALGSTSTPDAIELVEQPQAVQEDPAEGEGPTTGIRPLSSQLIPAALRPPPMPRDLARTFNGAVITAAALMRPFMAPGSGAVRPPTAEDMV